MFWWRKEIEHRQPCYWCSFSEYSNPCRRRSVLRQAGTSVGFPKSRPGWTYLITISHDGVIKWKHFPRYWPFVRRIHRSPVNSPHTKASDAELCCISLIGAWISGWVNNCKAVDLRRHRAHYNVIVMPHNVTTAVQGQKLSATSQGRHHESDRLSNHRRVDCLFNSLFRRRAKKTWKIRVTGLCEGNPPVAGGFPS